MATHNKRRRKRDERRTVGACLLRLAGQATERTIKAGAATYDRSRDLPALIHADPGAALVETVESVAAIIARLERALRAERNRARSGHWTYDLNRHIALRQALTAEVERLAWLRATQA